MIDWKKLREKYFNECVSSRTEIGIFGNEFNDKMICMAPHDLFEWFKKEVEYELNKQKCDIKIVKVIGIKKGTKEAKELNKLFEK